MLSQRDKKSLSQKALKTTEEVGELAKVILPYDNAFATNHRFVQKTRILEEVADVILCTLSVAYDLGFDDDDIESMIGRKADIWAGMQNAELSLKYPIPYEIHITVQKPDLNTFRKACEFAEVKPIILDLQDKEGTSVITDVMTSSKFLGDNRGAMEEVTRISQIMKDHGLSVVREKVETVPWHPAAPSENDTMPKDCYFECHFGVLVKDNRERDFLRDLSKDLDCHMSQNVFKIVEDGQVLMLTSRSYDGTRDSFEKRVEYTRQKLEEHFPVEKTIIEFAIYDTKVNHDQNWIGY